MSKRLYVAGPMRGYPKYNFPAFDHAAQRLREAGYEVVNPAELDRVEGVTEYTDPLPEGFLRDAMKRDLREICDCDGIALLPGWLASAGVSVELSLAKLIQIEAKSVGEWIADTHRHLQFGDAPHAA